MSTTAHIGISGWRYAPWRGTFYPKGLTQARELEYASSRLGSIELNGSFYALQKPSSFEAWKASTPDEFVFSVKGGRYITHLLKLKNAHTALANFFASGVLALEEKLGPLLWQLPEKVTFDAQTLDAFLAQLPATTDEALRLAADRDERMEGRSWLEPRPARPLRHALEVRHSSFDDPACHEILARHGVAMVVADTAGRWPMFRDVVTADFVYARLHGADELYVSGYTDEALDRWAGEVVGWMNGSGAPDGGPRDVYVYFDNDAKVRSPVDAMGLQQRVSALTG
ncbi:DUF72 domain-containing protein [Subtercola sp. Z020]|uniref:DUF72 domain-containing protein n=1 Tax=Subtercola sp. Z020 TaxID=2080582 RepID=UPI000CE85CD0|nr:DUF72 domain-containing protein [Subtercola sp. Z020]PPF78731.1 DUF72 domain-containing protein [Subtercola sp. Z020]